MLIAGRSILGLIGRLLVPTVIAAFAVSFYLSIADLDAEASTYPRLTIAFLMIVVLIEGILQLARWFRAEAPDTSEGQLMAQVWDKWRRSIYTIALVGLFIFAIRVLGFYAVVVPFLVILLVALGVRRPAVIGIFTVAMLGASYGLFELLLRVPLPQGLFG